MLLRRDKSTIVGISEIENIVSNNSGDIATIKGDETVDGSVAKSLKDAKDYAASLVSTVDLSQVEANRVTLATLTGDDTVDGSVAKNIANALVVAATTTDTKISEYDTATVQPIKTLLDVVNGASDVDGSFRKAISDVVGATPETLDTLNEIAEALNNDPDMANTLESHIVNATNALKDGATADYDTLKKLEDFIKGLTTTVSDLDVAYKAADTTLQDNITALDEKTLDKDTNLSELSDVTVARTNLDVPSNGEVTTAISSALDTVPKWKSEKLDITNDVFEASVPFNDTDDMNAVLNFGFVRIIKDGSAFDILAGLDTDADGNPTGKLKLLGIDTGSFDTDSNTDGNGNGCQAQIQFLRS